MLSRTESGVVVAISGDRHTILLSKGVKIDIRTKHRNLRLGKRCAVAFNLSTNKAVNITTEEDSLEATMPIQSDEVAVTPEEMAAMGELEWECSREQRFERLEREDEDLELELWGLECSRRQSNEGVEGSVVEPSHQMHNLYFIGEEHYE